MLLCWRGNAFDHLQRSPQTHCTLLQGDASLRIAASPSDSANQVVGWQGSAPPTLNPEPSPSGLTTVVSPACHPRAISSGRQRYPADSHGQSKEAVGLGASP